MADSLLPYPGILFIINFWTVKERKLFLAGDEREDPSRLADDLERFQAGSNDFIAFLILH